MCREPFDHRVDRAQADRDLEAKDVDCFAALQSQIDTELRVLFLDVPDAPHDLIKADEYIKEHTGFAIDIGEYLFDFAESETGNEHGVTCNPHQIKGFMYQLMYHSMDESSASEMAGIFAELAIQDGDAIIEFYRQKKQDKDWYS